MKLEKMKLEDLEVLSYTDLTEMILKENKKPMKTPDIFKKICNLLGLSEEDYTNKIGDFYTSMTTDKRFTLLENAEWDLKDNHKVEINLDEDDEEEYLDEESVDEEPEEEDTENSVDITDDEIDLDDEDDMEDLTIVTGDEIDDEE